MDTREALRVLESDPDIRVLHRFKSRDVYGEPVGQTRTVAVLDTETTGVDPSKDRVIEIGLVLVLVDVGKGRVCRVLSRHSWLEDPGHPLSEETKRLTGLTDDDVRGRRFDDEAILDLLSRCDLVIAHNASFDRPFLEKRYPEFAQKWWACSYREVDWKGAGLVSSKLEWLAHALAGVFYEGHRALVDAEVLVHVLASDLPDGRSVMRELVLSCRRQTYRVFAKDSPFDRKDDLKAAGYRWSDGTDTTVGVKAWYKDGVTDLEAERAFLGGIYPRPARIPVETFTGRDRFSVRRGERTQVEIDPVRKEA